MILSYYWEFFSVHCHAMAPRCRHIFFVVPNLPQAAEDSQYLENKVYKFCSYILICKMQIYNFSSYADGNYPSDGLKCLKRVWSSCIRAIRVSKSGGVPQMKLEVILR